MSADLPSALEALRARPQDLATWKTLGLMIIAQGTPNHLSVFEHRQKLAGDAVSVLFHSLFADEFTQNPPLRQRLLQFADHVPWDNPLGVVVRFFAACARLYDGDRKAAEEFRNVAGAISQKPQFYASIPHLSRSPSFARLITPPAETRVLWSDWGTLPHQHIIWSDRPTPPPGEEPLIFAACDGGYLDRFGPRFLEVVEGLGPIHIHIVSPTRDQLDRFRAKAGPNVFLSYETAAADHGNSRYYACARFFAAADVMRRYGRDMVMLDIDLERMAHLDTLFERTRQADIAYFAMPTLMPWLRHHAAFIQLRNRPAVLTFLTRFANLLSHQLPGAVWYVDQLCLGAAIAAYRDDGGTLAIDALEQADGFPFAHFILPAGDDAEKEKLRQDGAV